jgi:hypothetical protein
MTGLKYKLAHRRAEKDKWNATDNAQRKQLIKVLQELIDQLKMEEMGGRMKKDNWIKPQVPD